MQITSNTTAFDAACTTALDASARRHAVVVVKATFDVDDAGRCTPSARGRPLVGTDEHWGDPGHTAVRWENDFAPEKTRAEVLLEAHAVAPGGSPVTRLGVALLGPGLSKQAVVTGRRVWHRSLRGLVPSEPEPFSSLPLCWDLAFGGVDTTHPDPGRHGCEPRNLVGLGFHAEGTDAAGRPLPLIEARGQGVRSAEDRPEPLGFGPVGRSWQPRCGFAGTYDPQWMDHQRPFLPHDFDARFHLSAPLDQQCDRLEAGARYGCLNMGPRARFEVTLPPWGVPVRFRFDDRVHDALVRADTLWLVPGECRIVLVGRARVPLGRKLVALREVQVGRPPYRVPPGKRHVGSLAALWEARR